MTIMFEDIEWLECPETEEIFSKPYLKYEFRIVKNGEKYNLYDDEEFIDEFHTPILAKQYAYNIIAEAILKKIIRI